MLQKWRPRNRQAHRTTSSDILFSFGGPRNNELYVQDIRVLDTGLVSLPDQLVPRDERTAVELRRRPLRPAT